jgi:hypothetical protein
MREDSYRHTYSNHRLITHTIRNMFTRFYQSSPTNSLTSCLFYKWYQLLRLRNVQWRSQVIWRAGRTNTTVAPKQKLRTLQEITIIYWISLVFDSIILSRADNHISIFIIDPTHLPLTLLPFVLCRPVAETPLAFT